MGTQSGTGRWWRLATLPNAWGQFSSAPKTWRVWRRAAPMSISRSAPPKVSRWWCFSGTFHRWPGSIGLEWPEQPTRVIRNQIVREWVGCDDRTPPPLNPPQFIGHTLLGGQEYPIPKFSAALPTPDTTGDLEEMCLTAGESAGLVLGIKPAREIIREMTGEAERIIAGRLAALVDRTSLAAATDTIV